MDKTIREHLGYEPRRDEFLLSIQRNQKYKYQAVRQCLTSVCDVTGPSNVLPNLVFVLLFLN